jgi:hypothetical protein
LHQFWASPVSTEVTCGEWNLLSDDLGYEGQKLLPSKNFWLFKGRNYRGAAL